VISVCGTKISESEKHPPASIGNLTMHIIQFVAHQSFLSTWWWIGSFHNLIDCKEFHGGICSTFVFGVKLLLCVVSSGSGRTFDGKLILVNIISAPAAVSVRGSASSSEIKEAYGRILRIAVAFHLLGSDLGLKLNLKDQHRTSPWQSNGSGSLTFQFCLLSR
jgi:hypothetical protein